MVDSPLFSALKYVRPSTMDGTTRMSKRIDSAKLKGTIFSSPSSPYPISEMGE